jgi:dTDP-4-dehydrorhamnose reductase
MKILITGINGQVGQALMHELIDHELIGLTRKDCELTNLDFNLEKLHAIRTHEFPTKTKRPKNSILNNAKIKHTFNLRLNNWDTVLEMIIDEA